VEGSTDRTTLPKENKADTSSAEAPTAQALMTRSGSKASNDAPVDDNPDLINFTVTVSWVVGWTSYLTQKYWPDPGKSDGLVFVNPDAGPAFSVLSHEDVKGDFRTMSRLASLILLPSVNFRISGPDRPQLSLFSYDDLFAFSRFGLRWPNQDLLPIEIDRVHVSREWVFVELHLWTLCKLQSSFIYGRLNSSTENIAIVISMRIEIMPFTICMLF
jgi:hypothetical protein